MAGLAILVTISAPGTGVSAHLPASHEVLPIWPGKPPGTEGWSAAEEQADVTLPGVGKIHVITNVTMPTVTVFRPTASRGNGTAAVVLPGGSFRALAWDVDGLETGRWLAQHGITAFILEYRVRPPQPGESFGESLSDFAKATRDRRGFAVADAEQAIRLVRSHARAYGISPDRVGIIGFSAGAMATVDVALTKDPAVRPNFAVAMYGAALSDDQPGPDAPPLFIGAAQDDPQLPPANSAEIFNRWTNAKRPAELHIYETGGHGFGFRHHGTTSDRWPSALESWLEHLPATKR